MLLRTAFLSLLTIACCQISYGQYQPYGAVPRGVNAGPTRPVSHQTPVPAAAPAAAGGSQLYSGALNHAGPTAAYNTPPANAAAPHMVPGTYTTHYGMQPMTTDAFPEDAACSDGSCAPGTTNYVPWWHQRFVWSYWKVKGLPSPWCSPGNMSGHIPLCPCSGTYYYFRPYNWFHIAEQQQEAAIYEGDPRNPYDNRAVFEGLYGAQP